METPSPHSPSAEAQSVHLTAVRFAATATKAEEWSRALDHLERAAELGHGMAQASLAGLSGNWMLAAAIANGESTGQSWNRLRAAVRMEQWLATLMPRAVSGDPRIAVLEHFATPEICEWLMARARFKLSPAKIYDSIAGGTRPDPGRSNSEFPFTVEETDFFVAILRARIAAVTGLPLRGLEATTILHYHVGQQFLPHFDFLDDTLPAYVNEVATGGQRMVTFLMSLNDDYEGGETDFPTLGKRYRGRKGTAFFFFNIGLDGKPDRRTLHAGLPPTKGEKWILSQWLRNPPRRSTPPG